MKYLKIAIIVLVCVFLVSCLCGFIVMRRLMPPTERFYYSVGETFTMNSFEITVKDTKRYDYMTFLDEYNATNFEGTERAISQNVHVCMVYLDITNTSSEPLTPEIYSIYIGDPTAQNGLDLFTYNDLMTETTPSLKPTIAPGQTLSYEIPYVIAGAIYGIYEGDFFNKIDLELTFSVYPEKHVVKLNNRLEN